MGKKMKPDWDSLGAEYKDSTKVVIADVDCTAAGKPLCEKYGVRGYPTIKYAHTTLLNDPLRCKNLDRMASSFRCIEFLLLSPVVVFIHPPCMEPLLSGSSIRRTI